MNQAGMSTRGTVETAKGRWSQMAFICALAVQPNRNLRLVSKKKDKVFAMRFRGSFLLIWLVLFANITALYSQEGNAGQAGEFLRWGVGAKALGMGRAFSSIADDASALYWNPAGMANFEERGMS